MGPADGNTAATTEGSTPSSKEAKAAVLGEDAGANGKGATSTTTSTTTNSAPLKDTNTSSSVPPQSPAPMFLEDDSSFVVNLVFPDPMDPVQLQSQEQWLGAIGRTVCCLRAS
eukprot:gene24993-5969_t